MTEIEILAQKYLEFQNESDAVNLIHSVRCLGLYNIGIVLSKFFERQYPHSINIKDEYAINAYYLGNHKLSYDIYDSLLTFKGISEDMANKYIFNAHFSIDHICDNYTYYDLEKVNKIVTRKRRNFPLVTFSITSCKRFDLFTQTINSVINCFLDLSKIDEWICVDDNSSDEDRVKMKNMYPFFTFIFKTMGEKGHPQSMNIIRDMVKTPYLFHIEDDWKFFSPRRYISECLNVLGEDVRIGQCLVNKNYSETERDVAIRGGSFHSTKSGLRFFVHEMVVTDSQKINWLSKHGTAGPNCNYWPHFSFRPSLMRTRILKEIGKFNENISHFEMDYASRYINKGYMSSFLENIYCLHIGRLTSERTDKKKTNAYELNDEAQFQGKETKSASTISSRSTLIKKNDVTLDNFNIKMKTYVINLDKRGDRWNRFKEKSISELEFLNYERFSAVDGNKLISNAQLQRIFDGNDYNMRKGMVGCAMSHIKLYTELINSEYDVFCILEDDIEFVPEFGKKLLYVYNQAKLFSWDVVYLGHHLKKKHILPCSYDKKLIPVIEKWNKNKSLTNSLGGTGGYLISKKGAGKLLDFINKTGMTNGIDTVQQKAADELNIYYTSTHLFYSECYIGDNTIDTDIQYNHTSLTVPVEQRLEEEKKYHGLMFDLVDIKNALTYIKHDNISQCYFKGSSEDVSILAKALSNTLYPYYMLEDTVIIINVSDKRYIDRLKKDGKYNVEDALIV
jgi:GR25 family glycosyltransferase involved in LPS biosynthesis